MENEKNNRAASRGTWGREPPRDETAMERDAEAFFRVFRPPEHWSFLCWDRFVSPSCGHLLSVSAVFRDRHAPPGHERLFSVCFVTWPGRGALCERTADEHGRYRYKTVTSNRTAEKMNEYVQTNYNVNQPADVPDDDTLDALREKIRNL